MKEFTRRPRGAKGSNRAERSAEFESGTVVSHPPAPDSVPERSPRLSRPLSRDDLDDLLVDELLRRRRLDDATAIHRSIRRALHAVRRCLDQHPAWDDDDQDLETIDERLQEALNDAHRLVRRVKATRR